MSGPLWTSRFWTALLILFTVQLLFRSWFSPEPKYNWDAIMYMDMILQFDGMKSPAERHLVVYRSLKEEVPAETFDALTTTPYHTYRIGVFSDPQAMEEQEIFYRIKPLFILCIWLFFKLGLGLFAATLVPSVVAYHLIGILLFAFLYRRFEWWIALCIAFLFHLLPSTQELSAMSTPDSMSVALILGGTVILISNPFNKITPALFVLAILTRPEHFLFIAAIYAGFIWLHRSDRKMWITGGSAVLISGLVYYVLMKWADYPGWPLLFAHSFDGKMLYPVTEPRSITWDGYWKVMGVLYPLFATKYVIYFLFGFVVVFGLSNQGNRVFNPVWSVHRMLFLVILATHLIKFMLLPDIHDRFFYLNYVLLLIVVVDLIGKARVGES